MRVAMTTVHSTGWYSRMEQQHRLYEAVIEIVKHQSPSGLWENTRKPPTAKCVVTGTFVTTS